MLGLTPPDRPAAEPFVLLRSARDPRQAVTPIDRVAARGPPPDSIHGSRSVTQLCNAGNAGDCVHQPAARRASHGVRPFGDSPPHERGCSARLGSDPPLTARRSGCDPPSRWNTPGLRRPLPRLGNVPPTSASPARGCGRRLRHGWIRRGDRRGRQRDARQDSWAWIKRQRVPSSRADASPWIRLVRSELELSALDGPRGMASTHAVRGGPSARSMKAKDSTGLRVSLVSCLIGFPTKSIAATAS